MSDDDFDNAIGHLGRWPQAYGMGAHDRGIVRDLLNGIDRLKDELAAVRQNREAFQADMVGANSLLHEEVVSLRAELAAAKAEAAEERDHCRILRGEWLARRRAAKAGPPRPAALAWTREKPTEPGWYWSRGGIFGPGPVVVAEVAIHRGPPPLLAVRWGGLWQALGDGEWAGPIPYPAGPARAAEEGEAPS